jgi:F420H(2)-dependent quinone reductase
MTMPLWERYIGLPIMKLHDRVYKGTNGRIGHRLFPGTPPNLLLHTIGAKTGVRRTNSLVYAKNGDDFVVVASNGGNPKSPGWYHNLKAHPEVEINVGPRRVPVRAEPILPDDPRYQGLWNIANKNNVNRYDVYQKRTARPIPVVRLVP